VDLRHYLQFSDFAREDYAQLFERTRWIKARFKRYERYWPLADRTLAMIFEKQSTRTRLSFEAGMHQLGGTAIFLSTRDSQLGRGEPVEDSARVISRMCDVVMIRTFEQAVVERFAAHSRVPVINGLTDRTHPCQLMADVMTFEEHRGSIGHRVVAWSGDGNNMATSWIHAAVRFDFELRLADGGPVCTKARTEQAVVRISDGGLELRLPESVRSALASPGDDRSSG